MQFRLLWLLLITIPIITMERPISQDWQEFNRIYQPTDQNCRRISVNRYEPVEDLQGISKFRELACLIAGKKRVYHVGFHDIFDNLDPLLKRLIANQNIKEITITSPNIIDQSPSKAIIMYRPEGERPAYLLAVQILEKSLDFVGHPIPFSSAFTNYLFGHLVGYPEEDITFFYMLDAFQDKEKISLGAANFHTWPEPIKTKFFTYERNEWPQSSEYKEFLKDKRKAEQWLKSKQNLSIENLKKLIESLEKIAKKYIKADPNELFEAIAYNDPTKVELLSTLIPLDSRNTQDQTPLHAAIIKGNPAIVKILLDHGANPDQIYKTLWSGKLTPLMMISSAWTNETIDENQRLEIAKLLIKKGAQVNMTNSLQGSALLYAVQDNYKKIVELLFKAGAHVTPLVNEEAIRINNKEVIEILKK